MNCELPRFMSTERPLVWLEMLRMLPLRSNRPRTRPYCALNAAFILFDRGAGPTLPRDIAYGPFSPRPPKEGSTESGVRRVLLRFLKIRRLQNQMKKAARPITAKPPMTPPATATAELELELVLLLVVPPETATNVVVAPAACWEVVVEEVLEDGLLIPIVVNAAAVVETSVCRTSLWGGGATREVAEVTAAVEIAFTVDEAALLVSATLAWVCSIATSEEDETASGEEASIENWAIDVDDVVAGGVGVVAALVVRACGGSDTPAAANGGDEAEDGDDDNDNGDGKDGGEVEVLVVLEMVWLLTSVLGNAVHLLPPSVVMNAPRGKFGLVDIRMVVMVVRSAFFEGDSSRNVSRSNGLMAHCATGACKNPKKSPPLKGAQKRRRKTKPKASWAVTLEPNSSR